MPEAGHRDGRGRDLLRELRRLHLHRAAAARRAGLGASAITLVLLGFGLAGAASNFTAGVTVRAHLRATLMGSGLLVAVSALLLATLTGARRDLRAGPGGMRASGWPGRRLCRRR
jgi:hypothetical protein